MQSKLLTDEAANEVFEPSITENAETALVFSQDNGDSEMEFRDTQPCLRSIEKSRLSGIKRHLPLALPLQGRLSISRNTKPSTRLSAKKAPFLYNPSQNVRASQFAFHLFCNNAKVSGWGTEKNAGGIGYGASGNLPIHSLSA